MLPPFTTVGVKAQTSAMSEATRYSRQGVALTAPAVAATWEGVTACPRPLTHCMPPTVSICKHVGLGPALWNCPNTGIQLPHRKKKPQFLSSASKAISHSNVVISTSQGITVLAILPMDCDTPGTSGLRYPLNSKLWVLREILLGEGHISRVIWSSLWVWETWPSTEQRPYEGSLYWDDWNSTQNSILSLPPNTLSSPPFPYPPSTQPLSPGNTLMDEYLQISLLK